MGDTAMDRQVWMVWRQRIGVIGAILFFLIAIVLIDHLISRFLVKGSEFHVVRGETVFLTGPMPEQASTINQLTAQVSSSDIQFEFQEVFRGYMLGNAMWRATVQPSVEMDSGTYRIRIGDKLGSAHHPGLDVIVHVYPDELSRKKGHGSYLERMWGISIKPALMLMMPMLLVILGCNYLLSCKIAKLFAQEGKAEIYMKKKQADELHVAFSLGTRQGVSVGQAIDILDQREIKMDEAIVISVNETDAIARIPSPLAWQGGGIARLKREELLTSLRLSLSDSSVQEDNT
ncbi:hypothetical protein [Desulfatirhabdium butyrativorans]|uniref:hypothetical protein n=1 Tax=Desulfatirhabdium butyrativorans TaxID=340467 RepID=UPI0012EBA0E6|nr:hypothetical protein [Desulfatirhabdium butyrativorans]